MDGNTKKLRVLLKNYGVLSMANSAQFFSKVEKGHLNDHCRQSIANALKSLEGKFAKITIEEKKKIRSLNQNAFYWGYIIPVIVNFFNEYGNNVDAEQVHEFLKENVGKLNQNVVFPDGQVKEVTGSTANLNTMEFENYLTKIRVWAAEWGVIIPIPNEQLN
jgi:hypothetical protein